MFCSVLREWLRGHVRGKLLFESIVAMERRRLINDHTLYEFLLVLFSCYCRPSSTTRINQSRETFTATKCVNYYYRKSGVLQTCYTLPSSLAFRIPSSQSDPKPSRFKIRPACACKPQLQRGGDHDTHRRRPLPDHLPAVGLFQTAAVDSWIGRSHVPVGGLA